jgi:hypothetical protein
MIRAHVVLGLVFAGLLCAAPTAAAAPDTLLDFESLGEGTLVGTQGQLTFGTKTGLQFTAQPGSYDDVFAGTPSAGRPFRSCDRQLVVRAPGLRGQRRLQPQCGNLPDFGGPRDENRPAGFARFGATKSRVSLRFRPSPCVDQPPAPPFNGVPCDMRTALLAFDIHGNLLTKDVADVRGETLSVTRPVNDIAFIEVGEDGGQEPQETPIGIDDVVYDNPDVGPPPDFSLVDVSAAKPAGGTFRIALPISRINASAGAVTLSHAELPPGISSVDFDPDPSTSGATDMIVAIAPDAAPGVHQFTVTGTPAGPDAGPVARAATVRVDVKEPVRLFVDEPQPVDIYPCGSVTLHVKVAPHPDFQGGPITVTVDAVATGPLFVGDQSFTAPGDATTARDVTVSARPGASLYGAQAVTVRARVPGFPDQDLSVAVTPQAPALRSVEFVGDATPGYLSRVPGKLIGHGAGFCAGSIVEFGSPDAGGGFPTFVSANATQITSPIPPTAIPGYVAVRTPSDGTATLANVAIHGYRDLFGFAFANGGGKKFTAEDLVATFTDAGRITQICTNAGGTVTCRTSRLLSADAKGLVGRGGGGQCWGMATLSLRAQLRLWSTAGLPPSGGVPFDLKGPGGASAQLDDAIRLAQLSVGPAHARIDDHRRRDRRPHPGGHPDQRPRRPGDLRSRVRQHGQHCRRGPRAGPDPRPGAASRRRVRRCL